MLFMGLCCGDAKCLHHNISHCNSEDPLCHVDRTDPWFNFIANCWLFEAFSYDTVTHEMVYLIPVILSLEPPGLQLPQAFCETGDEQREYELSL